MTLKLSKTFRISVCVIVVAILAVAVLFATGIISTVKNTQESANSPESAKVAEKELFSFIDIEGWRKGPSNATSMAVFGNDDLTKVSPCFISVEYKKGTVDEDKKHLDNLETLTKTGDFDVEELQTATLGMQTTKGKATYSLHLLRLNSSGGQDIMSGNGLGYLQLSDGYIKITANCNTAEELPSTFPALESIKIDTF